jgi:hypothetical protein
MIEEIQCLSTDTRSDGCNDEVDADDDVREDTSHMISADNNDDAVDEDIDMDLIDEVIVRDDMSISTGIIEAVD